MNSSPPAVSHLDVLVLDPAEAASEGVLHLALHGEDLVGRHPLLAFKLGVLEGPGVGAAALVVVGPLLLSRIILDALASLRRHHPALVGDRDFPSFSLHNCAQLGRQVCRHLVSLKVGHSLVSGLLVNTPFERSF